MIPPEITFLVLLLSFRALDLFTTYSLTPDLKREINPLYRMMSWPSIILVNIALCISFSFIPSAAIFLMVISLIVSLRNIRLIFK